ncbi:MAG: methyltransferase domain-containing protein [Coprococcus sp.]
MTTKTLNYYNENAGSFVENTRTVDFRDTQDKFLGKLPRPARILDFGCGSGRDTKYFLKQGYKVDAVDGSKELCRLASEYTGIEVQCMLFQQLSEVDRYDGIWACSSILHLSKQELKIVLRKMLTSLKKNGIIYTSFKYGNFEGERNGRYFTDFTLESFQEYCREIDCMSIEESWVTGDVRPDRGDEKWLNLILRKK